MIRRLVFVLATAGVMLVTNGLLTGTALRDDSRLIGAQGSEASQSPVNPNIPPERASLTVPKPPVLATELGSASADVPEAAAPGPTDQANESPITPSAGPATTMVVPATSSPTSTTTTTTATTTTTTTTTPATTTSTTVALPPPPSRQVGDLIARVDAQWSSGWGNPGPDAVNTYYRTPGVDGLISAYRATGDSKYIDRAVAMARGYIAEGKPGDGDGYKDGYAEWYSSWVDRNSHNHVEWRAAQGTAMTVGEIFRDPKLASYRSQVGDLVAHLEKDVWDKWQPEIANTVVPHFIGRIGFIALGLWEATGKDRYHDYLNAKGSELRRQLLDPNSLLWADDVSHSGDSVNFIVEAYWAGFVFTAADLNILRDLVKEVLWNGSTTAPKFKDYLDGRDSYTSLGQNIGGWIKLSAGRPDLFAIFDAWAFSPDLHPSGHIRAEVFGALAHVASAG